MTSKDSSGNYVYEFTGKTKINFLFTDAYGKNQTKDLTVNKAGEYWYKDGKVLTYHPNQQQQNNSSDFRDETIYFVITSRFYDGDTSNNVHCWDDKTAGNPDSDPAWRGDLKGLIQKLDYIKAMGFSAIWVTPVVENASGYDCHGYHAINFKKVDSRYEWSDVTYVNAITGTSKIVSNGTLTSEATSQGDMRVLVLQNSTTSTSKIGIDGTYLR